MGTGGGSPPQFDLQLYVLVTSFSPLEVFIYDEGFARVSTHKFSAATKDLTDMSVRPSTFRAPHDAPMTQLLARCGRAADGSLPVRGEAAAPG